MYFHPLMFEWAKRRRTPSTFEAGSHVWPHGIRGQHQARADAVIRGCARHPESLAMLSGTAHAHQLVTQVLSRVAAALWVKRVCAVARRLYTGRLAWRETRM